MPGGSRSLPGRPSLRYLRLEAKRRLAAGEFPNLHDAQAAVAREHGLPSWAALKQFVSAPAALDGDSHALAQLRWVISRFRGAGQTGWTPPGEDELRQHFSDQFLAVIPPAALVGQIASMAGDLRGDPAVLGQEPLEALVRLADVEYLVVVEPDPPHRVAGLRALPTGRRVRDPRVTGSAPAPAPRTMGAVPEEVPAIADEACAELGLAALLLAGGTRQHPDAWVFAQGWADLDRQQQLDPGNRFPAPGVTALVTATAVLRLVAEGRVGLDHPANDHLRTVRLADDTVTVRDLLTHTGGVDDPADLYGDAVKELVTLVGPVIGCHGPRGAVRPSNGGVAVLGQLIEDVSRTPYADAVTEAVLRPLGMRDSTFPVTGDGIDPAAVTGYAVTMAGMFEPVRARICTIQAAGGLWSTGADLVRLGLGWSTLLPASLAHEALTPQTPSAGEPRGPAIGLGWILSPRGDIAIHAGAGPDATASLAIRNRDQRTHVILTSRMILVNPIEARLLRAWTNAS